MTVRRGSLEHLFIDPRKAMNPIKLLLPLIWLSGGVFSDPLPSWNNGETKEAIITFVDSVTDENSELFVPVEDRIAVFDNDGNLWAEKPVYPQVYFALDRIKAMAPDHPEWRTQEPYASVLRGDLQGLASSGEDGIVEIVVASHMGMTTSEFEEIAREWIQTARNPETGLLFTEMVYQPMLELLDYLRENDFETWIVSGGGIDFLRPWSAEIYGIPPQQVIGSSVRTSFAEEDGEPILLREAEIDFVNDKEGKPVGIQRHIGKKPIFASGNSDGDFQMLQYTTSGDSPSFGILLHHTDAEREWAYDRNSEVGKLDRGLDEAGERGWMVIDMAEDWNTVFPRD